MLGVAKVVWCGSMVLLQRECQSADIHVILVEEPAQRVRRGCHAGADMLEPGAGAASHAVVVLIQTCAAQDHLDAAGDVCERRRQPRGRFRVGC
jgi:hypothetical protein